MLDPPAQPPTQSPLTAVDVRVVRALLTSRPALLPIELIDIILDEAEYWPHSTVEVNGIRQVRGVHKSPCCSEAYLVTLPLAHPHTEGHHIASPGKPPAVQLHQDMKEGAVSDASGGIRRGEHPCRRIVFELHSRDQGWSDYPEHHGTYDATRSWFDVSVVRDFSSLLLLPPSAPADSATNHTVGAMRDRDLQRNVHAKAEETWHVIVWDWKDTIEEGSREALEAENG
ncbi:hypothetical protein CONPUDRAFT_85251 [Coniophora puteana RWD-64-598 SS2]|uniref:Uncharacterized protein n=1 Tax=Coniophora puteana (strain RWD-64-598) TaxID=741705 RepID=A0A5M3M8N4_CONPW|nr:uncharacterized protein CONPUDRAFT_85251 [Coniophora puteana RWD-64-598 SS2]EIW75417.1 hypothetical protein CONPUDRAFT_85251 [Coniophora puteana RWD-64-598 SS2]